MRGSAVSAGPAAIPRARATPGLDALVWATVGLTASLALYLTVGSLGWPLVHDGPLMHYVAARLLEALFAHAGKVGVTDIFLGTTDKFIAAHRFYEKNGFIEVSERDLPRSFPLMAVDSKFYRRKVVAN